MKRCPACGSQYPDDASFCTLDRTALVPLEDEVATEEVEDLDPMVGHTFADRYRILTLLGAGGMGRVYLAEHIVMRRRCAIKVLHQALSADPAAATRFKREAANAARINHPNVCTIYDFGATEAGLMYLAMEYIDGRSLSAELASGRPIPLARAGALMSDCCEALQAAHDLGIVHRDLKPDNIMLVQARDRETVKLVDFGIAKAIGGDPGGEQVTKTGFIIGTPEYMSPEQLSGDPVDPRSDIYSAALVFYRMVTGILPFASGTAQETLVKRLTEQPMSLEQALPDARFPQELEQAVSRALARWPRERYATAEAFGQEIASLARRHVARLAELPTVAADATRVATPDAVPPTEVAKEVRGGRQSVRARVPAILAAVGVVAIAGATGYALLGRSEGSAGGEQGARPSTAALDSAQGSDPERVGDSLLEPTALAGAPEVGRQQGGPVRDTAQRTVLEMVPEEAYRDTSGTPEPSEAQVLEIINETIVALQDSMFEVPEGRVSYRLRAMRIFEERTLPDSLRVRAALTVAAGHTADSQLTKAREWYVRAFDLIPESDAALRSSVKAQIDQLARVRN